MGVLVGFHDFRLPPRSVGGAPLSYAEAVDRLRAEHSGILPVPHDLHEILAAGEAGARRLAHVDLVLCTAGPYAHYYHYFRERFGGDYRIIRDAQTALWPPYLLQEELSGPLLRPGDLLLAPSEFARQLYLSLFPQWLHPGNVAVAYPLPTRFDRRPPRPQGKRTRRVGYLGRISPDKNLDDLIAIYKAARRDDKRLELMVAGPIYPATDGLRTHADLHARCRRAGLPVSAVHYAGELDYSQVWPFLLGLDVLVSPAVSSNETLCRVLAEAAHAGTPVVATNHAAAAELLPATSLVPCGYLLKQPLTLHPPVPLGAPLVEIAAAKVLTPPPLGPDPLRFAPYRATAVMDLLATGGVPGAEPPSSLSPVVGAFVRSIMLDCSFDSERTDALETCERLTTLFLDAHGSTCTPKALRHWTGRSSASPYAISLCAERLRDPGQRWALRNAMLYCDALGFNPSATLVPDGERDESLLKGEALSGDAASGPVLGCSGTPVDDTETPESWIQRGPRQ